MSPKIAIVLLVILIVVFVAVLGIGLTRGDGDSTFTTPSWAESIGSGLSLKSALDPVDDLGASSPSSCRAQFIEGVVTLDGGASCTLLVRESSARFPVVRSFSLELVQGGAVQVSVEQDDQITVKKEATAGGDSEQFDIYEDGGAVVLRCTADSNSACRVSVSPEAA